jgi:hypothetical protein
LSFSLLVTPTVVVVSILLRHSAPNEELAQVYVSLGGMLSVASLLSIWVLVAALIEHRPVWTDRVARWAWLWAVASCAVLAFLGLTGSGSQTVGALLVYAAGLFAIGYGGVGLVIAALPRWGRSGR